MSALAIVSAIALTVGLAVGPTAAWAESSRRTVELLSPVYRIDRIYKSMEGPSNMQVVRLLDGEPPELVWITAYRVVVVGPDGVTPASQEFMCHNNLDFMNVGLHNQRFGSAKPITPRLFTLSQGQFAIDFPEGFGFPVMSDESLALVTQVLNHNVEQPNAQVRHHVTVEFVRDRDLQRPMKPLFSVAPFVMVLLEGRDGYFGMTEAEAAGTHAGSCLPGAHAPNGTPTGLYPDQFGRKFSGHWVVKPGRQVNATPVTKLINLPYDTTLHYVAVHVHPYAESLELRDLTAGQSVFKSHVDGFADRVGVSRVETFSSAEGIPLFKDHEYELVSVYENPTGIDQDAMATFFLYLLDWDFRKPAVVTGAAPAQAVASSAPTQ